MFRIILVFILLLAGCEIKELPNESEIREAVSYSSSDSGNTTRLEFGTFDGKHHLYFLHTASLVGYFYMQADGDMLLKIGRKTDGACIEGYYNALLIKDASLNNKVGIYNTGEIYINNLKVLGPQQPAIANSDGSQEDNARAINELLEAYRNHGSIARGGADLAVKN